MEKKELIETLHKVRREIYAIEETKKAEIKKEHEEKVQPLLEQIADLKDQIDKAAYLKYAEELKVLDTKRIELTNQLDIIKVEEAKDVWYPPGTKVWLWERPKYGWSRADPEQTNQTGVVVVYDGTQKLADTPNWRKPNKGDILVVHYKKDGSVGLKYDAISERSGLNNYRASMWYAEGDTPTNNIRTRKLVLSESDEGFYE